ncbi:hypothetical protein J5N97_028386 [Dioscorea zingiberensis]|uniref:60S ribosomal protein L41 n=1 Tax=Dioscorea zingiberensis TaxID=325984 RepID=A0A9D5BYZ6_9LILI|nr:hypothetical protein J5N97_028386 [Dioscorea zingiberensis]
MRAKWKKKRMRRLKRKRRKMRQRSNFCAVISLLISWFGFDNEVLTYSAWLVIPNISNAVVQSSEKASSLFAFLSVEEDCLLRLVNLSALLENIDLERLWKENVPQKACIPTTVEKGLEMRKKNLDVFIFRWKRRSFSLLYNQIHLVKMPSVEIIKSISGIKPPFAVPDKLGRFKCVNETINLLMMSGWLLR